MSLMRKDNVGKVAEIYFVVCPSIVRANTLSMSDMTGGGLETGYLQTITLQH